MPQADIEINAVASSNEDLPINTVVQFSNNDVGDETTYNWFILSQPPGPADALSSAVIENPILLPLKEDTYLVRLIVDQGLPTEDRDEKLFRVRRFKTDAALVAIGEAISGTQGAWGYPQNETLNRLLNHIYDGAVVVAQAGGPITTGATVQLDETVIIKAGLPGQENVPRANNINATDPAISTKIVGIAIGKPNGDPTILVNDMVLVRLTGFLDLPNVGTPAIGDPVYASDAGTLALVPGTTTKKIGTVIDDTAGAWKAFLSTLTEAATGASGAAGGDLTGTYPSPTVAALAITDAKVAAANKDGGAGVASMRTLGASSVQACAGNDARLSNARPPNGAAGGELGGSYPNPTVLVPNQIATSPGTTNFGGGAYTLVAGMSITPVAGTYFVWFTGSVRNNTNGGSNFMSIFLNGVQVVESERRHVRGNNQITTTFACVAKVTTPGGQAIEGRWFTGSGVGTMFNRGLHILKVAV